MKLLPDLDVELGDFTNPELERLALWLTNCLILHPAAILELSPCTLTEEETVILASLGDADRAFGLSRIWEQHYQRWLQSV